jgi:hypothetical protein
MPANRVEGKKTVLVRTAGCDWGGGLNVEFRAADFGTPTHQVNGRMKTQSESQRPTAPCAETAVEMLWGGCADGGSKSPTSKCREHDLARSCEIEWSI